MRIYLIGMPGSGKSRTGKELASKLNYRLVDLDKRIEAKYGSIDAIFKDKGEDYFRKIETETLQSLNDLNDVIISCGGGVILNKINKKYMKGFVFFLNPSIDLLKAHLEHSEQRPVLLSKTIEDLYKERIDKYYDFSDFIIDYETSDKAVDKIIKVLKKEIKMKHILVINGPNLDMLGYRDKGHYGEKTLNDINKMMEENKCFKFEFFQSNYEGAIVEKLHEYKKYDGIIINPAAYTHTSVAIHDALEIVSIPKVEVHLSDVNNREDFRRINFITSVCDKTITGLKEQGYMEAINYLKTILNVI